MRSSTISRFIVLLLIGVIHAWGDLGHRTVAKVAYKFLSPATKQYLDGILAYGDNRDISDAAVWPDQIKYFRPYTAPWHYIDAKDSPPQSCMVNYPADCENKPGEGCIISAIANQTSLFMDPNSSPIIRQEALKFIIHFIGDLHQPLHTENLDRGGNEIPVCWRKACAHTNLHSVWDTYIPMTIAGVKGAPSADQQRANAGKWADELTGSSSAEEAANLLADECAEVSNPDKCSMEWAREVNYFNCKYVLQPSPDALVHQDLSKAYYQGAKPIVEYLIGKAGVRLAAWLEAMVASSPHFNENSVNYEFERVDLR